MGVEKGGWSLKACFKLSKCVARPRASCTHQLGDVVFRSSKTLHIPEEVLMMWDQLRHLCHVLYHVDPCSTGATRVSVCEGCYPETLMDHSRGDDGPLFGGQVQYQPCLDLCHPVDHLSCGPMATAVCMVP